MTGLLSEMIMSRPANRRGRTLKISKRRRGLPAAISDRSFWERSADLFISPSPDDMYEHFC
jgi:hypothetical protein